MNAQTVTRNQKSNKSILRSVVQDAGVIAAEVMFVASTDPQQESDA